MALTDHYGNALSTTSQDARDHYDRGVFLFLGANHGAAEAFSAAITSDPTFALAHAGHARASMMAGDMATAKASIAQAEHCADGLDAREQGHIAVLTFLLSGQPAKARSATLAHVRDYPRDAVVAQLCTNIFGLIGFSGEVGREADLLAYTNALLPHYGEDWWMMSMHALSLCETGKLDQSNALMDRSLSLNPRNANGSHFRAHAQYETGEAAEGRAYLTDWMKDYDGRAVLHGHLSWHLALWALHAGDETAMWGAVDHWVAPGAAQGLPINVLTDTAAILYRAQLAGMTVDPTRWSTLSDYAAQFFPDPGQSFADLHAALSHAMAGQGDRLARIAETSNGFAADLVRPIAQAWGAIARENWQTALDTLTPVMATTEQIGGSRAQRDLLELTYANVLLKLGLTDEARRSLSIRRPVLSDAPPLAMLA